MEYWRKPASDRFTQEALEGLAVDRPDEGIYRKVLDNWDRAAKPLDGMGRFEILTARIMVHWGGVGRKERKMEERGR